MTPASKLIPAQHPEVQPDPRGAVFDVRVFRRNQPAIEYRDRFADGCAAANDALDRFGLDVRVSARMVRQ